MKSLSNCSLTLLDLVRMRISPLIVLHYNRCNLRRVRIWLVTSSFCRGDNSMVAAWPDLSSLWRVCLARLKYMHVFLSIISENVEVLSELCNPINTTNQTFIMKHRPVAPGCRASRTSVAICTCTKVGHYELMQSNWTPAEYVNLMSSDALVHM